MKKAGVSAGSDLRGKIPDIEKTKEPVGFLTEALDEEANEERRMKEETWMKVLLLNGSPHKAGCTYTALSEIASVLKENGIGTEIFQASDCSWDNVKAAAEKMKESDALMIGSPVYWASPSGQIISFMDRFCGLAGESMRRKPGAVIASARRAGTTATLDVLTKYLSYHEMPIVSSTYWPMVHGNTPEEVRQDEEGLQIMRNLARNMVWLLQSIEAGKKAGVAAPEQESEAQTNFIR